MIAKENNYAYIDSQNLNLGVQSLGWKLDYKKFRVYLTEKYSVKIAYLFIGFIPQNQDLYSSLQKSGYILKFKPVLPDRDGAHKGNVDADMVLQIVIDHFENNCARAVLVTSDGDFYSAVNFLYEKNKLEKVISPYYKTCSTLLKSTAKEKLVFINNLQKKLEYKKKNTA
ncbi:NYN domain-containing protein [Candidatus Uhrbacteria bacterium]|nr:NYN domain-containing protein [Candidatus Uhrbacteria bacterium]